MYLDRLAFAVDHGTPLAEAIEALPVRRFLVVATEWESGHGGLSTFNRKLCQALAARSNDVVVCVRTRQPGPPQTQSGSSLRLVHAESDEDLNHVLRDVQPDFVIGHDRHTGPQALFLSENYRRCRSVLFIHTDPKIEIDKGTSKKEDKEQEQSELIRRADIVAAVGPRLADHVRDIAQGIESPPVVYEFTPGIVMRDEKPRSISPGDGPNVLFFGRAEDASLKGLDVFLEAVLDTSGKVSWEILGAEPETVESLFKGLRKRSRGRFDIRPYSPDETRTIERVRAAALVLMPSREEGFGLVALEALEANRPVLVSERSGFAEWLRGEEVRTAIAGVGTDPACVELLIVRAPDDLVDATSDWRRAIDVPARRECRARAPS